MKRLLFQVPPEHRTRITEQIAEIHFQRMFLVVPLLTVLGCVFLALDGLLLGDGGDPFLPAWYLVEDILFVAVQAGFLVRLSRGPRTIAPPLALFYVGFILAWGAVAGNVEFLRTGGFNTIFLALVGVSALGLFAAQTSLALIAATLAVYLGINLVWLGGHPFNLEKYFALSAVPFLAFAISQTLYAAVVQNLVAKNELEQANSELKEVRLNLIRQDKLASLGVLSAGLAHEINNPLAFIKSNVSALERSLAEVALDPRTREDHRAIFSETHEGFRRIGEVVHALGSFGRDLPAGTTAPYDLNQGIRATLVMTHHETAGDIVVDTDLDDLPPVPARGSEINQVLLNLLMNAIQAVRTQPPGQVRLIVVRTRLEEGAVVAEVTNSGPPVPTHLRERIFEPFFSTKAPGSGMGLGLSLSWQIIVHRHGGDLELSERLPVTFRIRLPLQPRSLGPLEP